MYRGSAEMTAHGIGGCHLLRLGSSDLVPLTLKFVVSHHRAKGYLVRVRFGNVRICLVMFDTQHAGQRPVSTFDGLVVYCRSFFYCRIGNVGLGIRLFFCTSMLAFLGWLFTTLVVF